MSSSGSEWYKEWFDTRWYHILYQNRDVSEAENFIDHLDDYLLLNDDQKILDQACGKGRHSVYLNLKGRDVVGLDLSEESISFAKQYENKRLYFDVHDMREVFKPNYFDVVLNLFTSFGYFDDDADNGKIIQSAYTMLKPRGYFVLDFMNTKRVIQQLVPSEEKEIDGILFQIERNFNGIHIEKNIRFHDEGKDFHFVERVRGLLYEDFMNYINLVDFELINVFGDYNLNPYDELLSDRMIFVVRKRK